MHIIAKTPFVDFWKKIPASETPLRLFLKLLGGSKAQNFTELKQAFSRADYVPSKYTVFDICRNEYRVVAVINYSSQRVYIRFVGTHKEYDNWTKENRRK